MLTKKRQSLLTRMAMTLILALVGMVASAQTFVVVDKNGNRITYDVSKVEKVTFSDDPPSFTVHEMVDEPTGSEESGTTPGTEPSGEQTEPVVEETTFAFDDVSGFSGDPDFLFAHPDTVYVGAEAGDFKCQFRTNVDYTYKLSDSWLEYVSPVNNTDSLLFNAAINPMTTRRVGYVAFASKDEEIVDTLWVVQAGKLDSRYIDIDWTKTTLDSFDEESGKATLTFAGDVPVMGDYDVVLLPKDGSYVIRLIDKIDQEEGAKTVNLTTRQGVMGNLFKGTKFSLATEASAKARGDNDDIPVYLPTKVEMMTDDGSVELYNANKSQARGTRAPTELEKEFVSWEYNQDGLELWSSGVQSLSWDKLNFNIGLKGLFSFDFGDIPWEKVRMGDLQNLKISLEGGFDMEMIMKYTVASEVSYEKEWTLKENAIPNLKYTFMVGTVPVYITVGADLMANISLGASGEASITTGVTASTKVNYGVEWDYEKGLSKIAECEKELELVGPDPQIKAHAEARATAYPKIEIGIYKVLCPTISPQPYLKAEADGRLVDNSKVAWNAGVSTGVDLGLGLCLDLFFWKKDLGEIDPINVFDLPIVSLPDEIELLNEPEEEVVMNSMREVKYHVTNKNYLTGTTYNAPGVLVHFEAEGGELEDEYGRTDSEGNVSAFFTLTDTKGGTVKTEVVLGAEPEKKEDAMKADNWKAIAIDHRLTPSPASQEIKKDATAAIIYKLERYTSKTGEWTGFGGQTVEFEATGGTVAPTTGVTAQDGTVAITFTPEDGATEGKVTGSLAGKDPDTWGKISSAVIKIKEEEPIGNNPCGCVISDEDLLKADLLKDNTYVYEDKNGNKQEYNFVTEGSEWRWSDGSDTDKPNIWFTLENADENGMTLGDCYGLIPSTLVGSVNAITPEFLQKNAPFQMSCSYYGDSHDNNGISASITCKGGETFGNIKLDGSSKFLIAECVQNTSASRTRSPEYEGKYILFYHFVFTKQVYNEDTQQYEDGDEYTVYGKGIMPKHVPSVTSFQLSQEKDWVKVGESTKVKLESYYEEEATWDWNDVQMIGQSTDYDKARAGEDEGFFSWDAATQTLTSLKSNDNKRVNVCLGLISNPDVKYTLMISTGEGWNYTMITPSQDTFTYTGYGYLSFSFDWTPKASEDEKFDFNSIEIDPETNPNGYFSIPMSYASQGWPLYVDNAPKGEYNVRIRIKSNHDVNCTIKVISELEE